MEQVKQGRMDTPVAWVGLSICQSGTVYDKETSRTGSGEKHWI